MPYPLGHRAFCAQQLSCHVLPASPLMPDFTLPLLYGGKDLKQEGNHKETSRKPLQETTRFVWGKRSETGRKPVGNQSETTPGNQPICVGENIPTLSLALQKGSGNQSETSRKPLQETTRFVWGKGSGARSGHPLGFIIIKTKRKGVEGVEGEGSVPKRFPPASVLYYKFLPKGGYSCCIPNGGYCSCCVCSRSYWQAFFPRPSVITCAFGVHVKIRKNASVRTHDPRLCALCVHITEILKNLHIRHPHPSALAASDTAYIET